VGGDDHLILSKAPRALDMANCLLRQLSFPVALALLMRLLTQRARRPCIAQNLHTFSATGKDRHEPVDVNSTREDRGPLSLEDRGPRERWFTSGRHRQQAACT
jgi:hypothetical protein